MTQLEDYIRRCMMGDGTISGDDAHSAMIPPAGSEHRRMRSLLACRRLIPRTARRRARALPETSRPDRLRSAAVPHPAAAQDVVERRQRHHPDAVGAHERQRGDRDLGQHARETIGGDELDASAVERDRRPDAAVTALRPVKRAKRVRRLLDIGDRDGQAAQAERAIGMRQPARLPDHVLRPVGEHLDAAFRHLAWLDSRDREGGGPGCAAGIDRALHLHQRPQAKA